MSFARQNLINAVALYAIGHDIDVYDISAYFSSMATPFGFEVDPDIQAAVLEKCKAIVRDRPYDLEDCYSNVMQNNWAYGDRVSHSYAIKAIKFLSRLNAKKISPTIRAK